MTDMLLKIDHLPELDLIAFNADPAATLDALRPHRIVRSTRGFEVIAYDLVHELFADQRLRPMSAKDFSSHGASDYIAEFVDKGIFLFMEPERHKEIRKVFMKGFAGKAITDNREPILEIGNKLVDRLLEGSEGDLVEDFTVRLSAQALCRVVGYPPDEVEGLVHAALDLRKLVYVPMQPHVPDIEKALRTLHHYADGLIAERRHKPQGDFLSTLIEGGQLTADEIIWGTVNLLLGGIDTTNFQLASTLQHMIRQGVWEQASTDSALRNVAIEEATRLTPVATMLGRIVHEALVIDGVELPVGANVRLNMVAAGRDPAKFANPHSYDLSRKPPFFPTMFGNGPHVCIGRNLAWHELRVGTEVLTSRLTDIAFTAEPEMYAWTDAFYGPSKLPVSFRAR